MQLDRTRIAIRERNLLDIFDLALRVIAAYPLPWIVSLLVIAVPMAVINIALIGWMPGLRDESDTITRYVWGMFVLVFIEAPAATSVITLFFGQAMFMDQPQPREILSVMRRYGWNLFWCQMVLRGIIPLWGLYLMVPRDSIFGGWEVWGIILVFYMVIVRCVRPFLNEIVLLERNPLRSRRDYEMTIGRRSSSLHNPNAGDLIARWLGVSAASIVIFAVLFFSGWFLLQRVFLSVDHTFWLLYLLYPCALWLVAGYVAVVRFLCYLDLRIRREGWEVELIVRSAANDLVVGSVE